MKTRKYDELNHVIYTTNDNAIEFSLAKPKASTSEFSPAKPKASKSGLRRSTIRFHFGLSEASNNEAVKNVISHASGEVSLEEEAVTNSRQFIA